jgi:choline kinase
MKAIILAAGAGRRLGSTCPKCMLDIGGVSIIHRQLAAFRAAGLSDFVVVVGYAQKQLRDHLVDQPGRFSFVVNDRYAETNTIYSLYLARHEINDTFYYANGDVVFDHRLIAALASAPAASTLAVKPGPCRHEEVKVIVRQNRVIRIGKKLDPDRCRGEFIGVARFGRELAPAFVAALTDLVESAGLVNDYFEAVVDRLCPDWPITSTDVSDLPCREIDFPEDLAFTREQIAPRLQS